MSNKREVAVDYPGHPILANLLSAMRLGYCERLEIVVDGDSYRDGVLVVVDGFEMRVNLPNQVERNEFCTKICTALGVDCDAVYLKSARLVIDSKQGICQMIFEQTPQMKDIWRLADLMTDVVIEYSPSTPQPKQSLWHWIRNIFNHN